MRPGEVRLSPFRLSAVGLGIEYRLASLLPCWCPSRAPDQGETPARGTNKGAAMLHLRRRSETDPLAAVSVIHLRLR